MPYKVIIDHPSIGDETDLYIHGLGTFKNHTETVVDDDQIERFRAAHAVVNVSNPHPETGSRALSPARGKHPVDLDIFGVRVEPVGNDSTGSEAQ